uniref:ORF2_1 protein n=1 Tax=Fopius arisanus TaxID=64838 RepID=A0A0C9QS20_9HYME
MKIYFFVCVLLSVDTITGLDPALDGDPRRSFPIRRAIDGSRGRKYYVPDEEDTFETHGASGQYDPYRDTTDFSDIRANVPGEPGVDYPSYVTIPQTSFQCQNQYRGE